MLCLYIDEVRCLRGSNHKAQLLEGKKMAGSPPMSINQCCIQCLHSSCTVYPVLKAAPALSCPLHRPERRHASSCTHPSALFQCTRLFLVHQSSRLLMDSLFCTAGSGGKPSSNNYVPSSYTGPVRPAANGAYAPVTPLTGSRPAGGAYYALPAISSSRSTYTQNRPLQHTCARVPSRWLPNTGVIILISGCFLYVLPHPPGHWV